MTYFRLRLKLLLTDRTATLCCILSAIVIVAVLLGLNVHAAERSSIPIGVINSDSGKEAAGLFESLKNNEALYVYEGSFDYLWTMMLDGYINSIFVIENGYSEAVRAGRTAELITVHSPKDDRISAIISDIVAGCMLYDICLNKSFLRYSKLDTDEIKAEVKDSVDLLDREGYAEYIKSMSEAEDYAFSFDIHYIDSDSNQSEQKEISNALLYRQMIAGMLAMLILLVEFCSFNPVVSEFENGIYLRCSVLPGSGFKRIVGEVTASIVYSAPILFTVSAVFTGKGGIPAFLRVLSVNIAFALFCVILFCILARMTAQISAYQLAGAIVLIVLSLMGFVSVFSGVLGRNALVNTPVAIYIKQLISFGGI